LLDAVLNVRHEARNTKTRNAKDMSFAIRDMQSIRSLQ
jgi:hypothetical protein